MVYYKYAKIIINTPGLAEVILNIFMRHHNFLNLTIINEASIFTLNFWLSLYYFLNIKWKLLTTFYPQTNSQTKR